MIEKEQALLAQVVDLIARTFDKKAILRGGMVLRILGSERLTNDIDYVFVPYRSKKDIVGEIVKCLKSIEGAVVEYSLNSKCLRAVVTVDQTTIQVEAKVALEMRTAMASTRLFSPRFNLPRRIIPVVDHSVALANKMAAWNERRLIRDLYDIWFYLQMQVVPDAETLRSRLRRPCYSKLVKKEDHFVGGTVNEFYDFLRAQAAGLSDDDIRKAMADYLPPDETVGLAMLIRAALARLR